MDSNGYSDELLGSSILPRLMGPVVPKTCVIGGIGAFLVRDITQDPGDAGLRTLME